MAPPRLLLRRDASQLSVSGVGRRGEHAARARGCRTVRASGPRLQSQEQNAAHRGRGAGRAWGGRGVNSMPSPQNQLPVPPPSARLRSEPCAKVKCELVTLSLNISTSRPASSDRPPTDCPEARCGVVLDRWDTTTSVRGEGRNNHGEGKDDMQV